MSTTAFQSAMIARLEADVRAGRNPRAWIPLSQELRRQNKYPEALVVCHDGLSADQGSVAGVTELVRVLGDMGRYGEALQQIERLERRKPGSSSLAHGLLLQKLRCQIRLLQVDEAEFSLSEMERSQPFDPALNALRAEVRHLRALRPAKAAPSSSDTPAPVGLVASDFIRALRSQVRPLGKVLAVALVDRENKQSVVEGDDHLAELAARLEVEIVEACADLGHGTPAYQLVETTEILVVLVRKGEKVLVLATDPGINFGRVHHIVTRMTGQQLPAGRTASGNETTKY